MTTVSTDEILFQAFEQTLKNGGATVSPLNNSIAPRRGYMVGGVVPSLIVPLAEFHVEILKQFVSGHMDDLLPYSAFLGTWVNDHKVYIDISEHYADRQDALDIAKLRGELAVWDLDNEQDIEVQ